MRRRLQHSKRLRSISMLPTLLTLGNLLCGFASIHFVAKYMVGVDVFSAGHASVERWLPTHLGDRGVPDLHVDDLRCPGRPGRAADAKDE